MDDHFVTVAWALFLTFLFLGMLSTCIPRPRKKDVRENIEKAEREARAAAAQGRWRRPMR